MAVNRGTSCYPWQPTSLYHFPPRVIGKPQSAGSTPPARQLIAFDRQIPIVFI